MTSITVVTAKSKHTVQYTNLLSAMRSVPHSAKLPVSKPPTKMMLSDIQSSDEVVGQAESNMDCYPTFAGATYSNEPHQMTQVDLNNFVRDLNVSKEQAELLETRLKSWTLLGQDSILCYYRGQHENSSISSPRKMV
jgi:hypothetical protein